MATMMMGNSFIGIALRLIAVPFAVNLARAFDAGLGRRKCRVRNFVGMHSRYGRKRHDKHAKKEEAPAKHGEASSRFSAICHRKVHAEAKEVFVRVAISPCATANISGTDVSPTRRDNANAAFAACASPVFEQWACAMSDPIRVVMACHMHPEVTIGSI